MSWQPRRRRASARSAGRRNDSSVLISRGFNAPPSALTVYGRAGAGLVAQPRASSRRLGRQRGSGGAHDDACTAVGLAQLAFLDDRELESRYRDPPRDDLALERIRACRQLIRRRGWASERGETAPGVPCVAAPIFDHAGTPIGAVGATYLEATARGFDLSWGPRPREAAPDISRQSGFAARCKGDGTTARHAIGGRVR